MNEAGNSKHLEGNNDGKPLQQNKEIKPLRHIPNITDANGTASSSSHPSELAGTSPGDESDFGPKWQEKQKTGFLKAFQTSHEAQRTGKLGDTQKPTENQNIESTAEIPGGDNITPPKSLSAAEKARDRKVEGHRLYENFIPSKL